MSLIVDPSTLSPTGWWVADDITGTDGSSVTTWPDSSGGGHDFSQSTAGYKPKVYVNMLNGHKAVLFDGTDDYMATAVTLGHFTTPVEIDMSEYEMTGTYYICYGTFMALISPTNGTTDQGVMGAGGVSGTAPASGLYLDMDSTPKRIVKTIHSHYTGDGWESDLWGSSTINAPMDMSAHAISSERQWHIVSWRIYDTGTDAQVDVFSDNLDDVAAATNYTAPNSSYDDVVQLGRYEGGTEADKFLNGYVVEVLFFNTALTEVQRQGIGLYWANKYAIAYGSSVTNEGAASAPVKIEMKLPSTELGITPSAWFKADSISTGTSDGTAIGSWSDSSTEAHDLAQTATTSKPTYKTNIVNSKPALLFERRDRLQCTGSALNTIFREGGEGTVFAVVKPITSSTNNAIWSSLAAPTSSGSGMIVKEATAGSHVVWGFFNDGSTKGQVSRSVISDQFGIYAWQHGPTGHTGSSITEHVPGFDWTSTGMQESTGTTGLDDLANYLYLGHNAASTVNAFYLAELLFFRDYLTQVQRRHVHAYLANKYALSYSTYSGSTDYEPMWVDVTDDVCATPGLKFNYGIDGASPTNRTASAGRAVFSMDNSVSNSGGVKYYYSPGSTACRMGWNIGVGVRISFEYYGTRYYKWLGHVTDILPSLGKGDSTVRVTAMDYIDTLARLTLSGLPLQTNVRADEVISVMLVAFPLLPEAYVIGTGSDTYAYALDCADDEKVLALAEFNKVAMSEMGFVYVTGDTNSGGRLVFEPRGVRGEVIRWHISEDYIRGMTISNSIDDIINRILVRVHPRRVESGYSALFNLGDAMFIESGSTITFNAPYRDPDADRSVRIGGTSMIQPESTDDYTANTDEDGGGSDLTEDFTVSCDYGANSANVTVVNGAGDDGYLTFFQFRGKAICSFEDIVVTAQSTPSMDKYGANTVSIDMPYNSSPHVATLICQDLIADASTPAIRVRSVDFQPNVNSIAMMHAMTREIGDLVSISETVSGLSSDQYFIQNIEFNVKPGSFTEVSYKLAPAGVETWSRSITTG